MALFEGITAAMGVLGALDKNRAQQEQSSSTQAFSAQQFATRYQTTVADMQAAGLNPMLAYNQGGGSPPTGVLAPMEGFSSGVGGAALAAKLAEAQIANVEADTEGKLEQASVLRSQVRRNVAGAVMDENLAPGAAANQSADTMLKGAQGELAGASAAERRQAIEESQVRVRSLLLGLEKSGLEMDQIRAVINEVNARTGMIPSQIQNLNWDSLFKAAGVGHLKAETLQIKSLLPAAIAQMQNLSRLTGLEGDSLVGQAVFGSGVGGQIKPWASMIGDLVPGVSIFKGLK